MAQQTSRTDSIARAMAKARQVAGQGAAPRFIGWTDGAYLYRVASVTHAGHEYLVTARRVGLGFSFATMCECEAAQRGLICWHRALVRLDLDGELTPVAAMAGD
jgi:hypothetical protein